MSTYPVTTVTALGHKAKTNAATGHVIAEGDTVTVGKSKNEWLVTQVFNNHNRAEVELHRQTAGRVIFRRYSIDQLTVVSSIVAEEEAYAEARKEYRAGRYAVRNTDTGVNVEVYNTKGAAEKFAASYNRYENAEYVVKYLPTAEDITEAIEDMKAEILADIADGTQPKDVADFSTLHDYVDANCYAGFCEDDKRADWDFEVLNSIQHTVDAWLKAGRPGSPTPWPTADDLVNYMRNVISKDLASGEAVPSLDELCELADDLFPFDDFQGEGQDQAHARAVAIMNEAKATMEQIMPAYLPSAEEDIITEDLGTVSLSTWVPALAKQIHGTKWTPNHDMTTHLEAQRVARTLGVKWSREMPVKDVEDIKAHLLTKHGK